MSQSVDIQLISLEEILEILRKQAIATPNPVTSSRYLRALDSLSSWHSQWEGGFPTAPSHPSPNSKSADRLSPGDSESDNSSLIIDHLSLSLTDWLVSLWLTATPFATSSLYLDIISSLYGSAVKSGLLPPTKLFSQLKSRLKDLGPEGWKQGINDEIFTRALRLTKNASRLIADDATAAQLVIYSLTHSLLPLTQVALLKKSDLMESRLPSRADQAMERRCPASPESTRSVDRMLRIRPHADQAMERRRPASPAPTQSVDRMLRIRPESTDGNFMGADNNSSLKRERYAFPLRQSQRTPKQLAAHIAKIVNALFKRARLPQATDPFQTVEALWAYAALRTGIPGSAIVSHIGHAPLGLPVLKLSARHSEWEGGFLTAPCRPSPNLMVADRLSSGSSDCEANTAFPAPQRSQRDNNLSLIGNIFLENPPLWYAMSLRPGVRFTQVCQRIQLLHSSLFNLNSSNLELFYPCEEIARAIGKKIVTKQRPFIPSVVFFRAKLTDIGPLFSKIGDLAWCYRQSARPGAPYASISQQQFELFQRTIAQFTPDYEVAPSGELELHEGDRVEILGGLFAGQSATVMERRRPASPSRPSHGTEAPHLHEPTQSVDRMLRIRPNPTNSNDIVNGKAVSNRLEPTNSNSKSADSESSIVYRLNIIGDNGIEWRITADPRLLSHET